MPSLTPIVRQTDLERALPTRVGKVLSLVLFGMVVACVAIGCLLYTTWSSSPPADRMLSLPFERFLLYADHYDWVRAPFLQAFQAATVCTIFLAFSLLLPRIITGWKTWIPSLVFAFSIQIAFFNAAVNSTTGNDWLYDAYLVMSWSEPWLLVTLADVRAGFYSTGGVAAMALLLAGLALFALRSKRGFRVALLEACLFLTASLFLFELGILEYKPSWWNSQVSYFQFTLGVPWLTNHMLFSSAGLAIPLLVVVRLVQWTASRRGPEG